jgi:ABC-2 type transport system permease protein
MKVRFTRTGEELDTTYDQVRIARAVYTLLADLPAIRARRRSHSRTLPELAAAPRKLTSTSTPRANASKRLPGFEQSVPGTMVMFTLLVLFTSGAVTLTIERRLGILRRLASSPMSRGAVVLGKWGARMAVGTIQIAVRDARRANPVPRALGAESGRWWADFAGLWRAGRALAMLLGNFGRTEGQVIGLGVILSNVMAGLGGCWWPIEVTPPWAQKAALCFCPPASP